MNYIVDAHSHLPKDGKIKTLLNNMDKLNVQKNILVINTQKEFELFKENIDDLKANLKRFGILIGLDYNNPLYLNNLEYLKQNSIKYGIKLHSRYMNITEKDFINVFEAVKKSNTDIILVDCFPFGPNYKTHIGIELGIELAQAFKDKKIVLAHSGGIDILRCMLLTRSLSNVYYDLSLTVPYLFNTSIHNDIIHFIKYTSNRIMYGSDYPDFSIEDSKEKFYTLFKEMELDDNKVMQIMYKNALDIYSSLWMV